MDIKNFSKGVGVGLVVGSALVGAIGVVSANPPKKTMTIKKNPVARALKTVGDVVENISDSIGL